MSSPHTATYGHAENKTYAHASRGLSERLGGLMLWLTQAVLYPQTWLTWNQRPAVLFDMTSRCFFCGAPEHG